MRGEAREFLMELIAFVNVRVDSLSDSDMESLQKAICLVARIADSEDRRDGR